MLALGKKARDKITGFTGILTGKVVYISGCNQWVVQPQSKADGDFIDGRWIDEQRLELVSDEPAVSLDNTRTPGCDLAPPVR